MSPEQIGYLIGGSQLLLGALVWLGVDAKFFKERLPSMSRRNKLVGILLIGGLLFSGIGFYHTLSSQAVVTPDNIEKNIKDWLYSFGYEYTKAPIEDPQSYFVIKVSVPPMGRPVFISRSKKLDRYITFDAAMSISPEHKTIFDKLDNTQQKIVIHDLTIEMARFKIGFVESAPLQTITIQKHLPITDTLTEYNIIESINEMDNALLLAIETFRKDIGQ